MDEAELKLLREKIDRLYDGVEKLVEHAIKMSEDASDLMEGIDGLRHSLVKLTAPPRETGWAVVRKSYRTEVLTDCGFYERDDALNEDATVIWHHSQDMAVAVADAINMLDEVQDDCEARYLYKDTLEPVE